MEDFRKRLDYTEDNSRITCSVCDMVINVSVKYNCLFCNIEICEPCYYHIILDPTLRHTHDQNVNCLIKLELVNRNVNSRTFLNNHVDTGKEYKNIKISYF